MVINHIYTHQTRIFDLWLSHYMPPRGDRKESGIWYGSGHYMDVWVGVYGTQPLRVRARYPAETQGGLWLVQPPPPGPRPLPCGGQDWYMPSGMCW